MYDMKADFKWFNENREEIIKDHINKRVVIRNKEVLGYYPTDRAAIDAMAAKGLPMGEYSVQKCIPEENDINYYYTGRYAFA